MLVVDLECWSSFFIKVVVSLCLFGPCLLACYKICGPCESDRNNLLLLLLFICLFISLILTYTCIE